MSGPGRPRIYDREAIKAAFTQYVESTEIPIIAEFAVSQGFGKQVIQDLGEADEDFSYLIKKCTSKKEAALERKGLSGDIALPMAIFSLKQLGWTDKQENTLKGDKEAPIVISQAGAKW